MKIIAELPQSIVEFSVNGTTIKNTYDEKECSKCKGAFEKEAKRGTTILMQVK